MPTCRKGAPNADVHVILKPCPDWSTVLQNITVKMGMVKPGSVTLMKSFNLTLSHIFPEK